MNLCEKANIRLMELDQIIIGLFDQRIMLASIIKEDTEKKLAELREGYGYGNPFLNSMRETVEKPLNDVIKQANELIAQSKQMKEMLLNPQDSEDTAASNEQIIDGIRQGVQKAIHGTAE